MSYNQPAPDGGTFSPDAFDSQVGEEIPVRTPDGTTQTGRVVAAKIAEDGQSAELTIDVPIDLPDYGAGSFGFR